MCSAFTEGYTFKHSLQMASRSSDRGQRSPAGSGSHHNPPQMNSFKQPRSSSEFSKTTKPPVSDDFKMFEKFQQFLEMQGRGRPAQHNRNRSPSPDRYRRHHASRSNSRSPSPQADRPYNSGGRGRGGRGRGGHVSGRGSGSGDTRGSGRGGNRGGNRGRGGHYNNFNGTCSHTPITKKLVAGTMASEYKDKDVSEYPWNEITIKYFCSACRNKVYVNPTAFGVCYVTSALFINIKKFHVEKRATVLNYFTKHIDNTYIEWAQGLMNGEDAVQDTTSNEYHHSNYSRTDEDAEEPDEPQHTDSANQSEQPDSADQPDSAEQPTKLSWADDDGTTDALKSLSPVDRAQSPTAEEQQTRRQTQAALQQQQQEERAKQLKEKEEAMMKKRHDLKKAVAVPAKPTLPKSPQPKGTSSPTTTVKRAVKLPTPPTTQQDEVTKE